MNQAGLGLRQLFDKDTSTYTYLLFDTELRVSVIIDPVLEQVERDMTLIRELDLNLTHILETHVHADHVTGAASIREITKAMICVGTQTGVKGADIYLKDGDQVVLNDFKVQAIATPGHTAGCTSYLAGDMVFTGDSLFIRGTGRTDFQGGSPELLYRSIRENLFTLPDNTQVYPAHDYSGFSSSTIREEKDHNPKIGSAISRDQFVNEEQKMHRSNPKRMDTAVPANLNCGVIASVDAGVPAR